MTNQTLRIATAVMRYDPDVGSGDLNNNIMDIDTPTVDRKIVNMPSMATDVIDSKQEDKYFDSEQESDDIESEQEGACYNPNHKKWKTSFN